MLAVLVAFRIAGIRLHSATIVIAILASFLYAVNFLNLHAWSVIWRTKFTTQFLLPILILYLYTVLERRVFSGKKLVLISILSAFFNSGGSPPLYGPLAVAWFTTGLYSIVLSRNRKETGILFIKTSVFFVLLVSLLSAYWLIPYTFYALASYASQLSALGGVQGILGIVDAVSKNASMLNVMRLQGLPAWDSQSVFPFMLEYIHNPLYVAASFVWSILAVSSYFLAREKKERRIIGLFLLLLVIGMFFTAGSHPPTGAVFNILVQNIPGFGIFRTSFYKFGMIPWLCVSVLAAFSFVRLSQNIARHFGNKIVFSLLMVSFLAFSSWYYLPFLQGKFFDYNKPFTNKVRVPHYVTQAATYIEATTDFEDRILIVPRFDESHMDGYTWGYWSPDPLARMIIHRPLVSDANNPPGIVNGIYTALSDGRTQDFLTLLRIAGIRTVLWRGDILYSDKKTTAKDFSSLEQQLAQMPELQVAGEFGAWRVYRVTSTPPHTLFAAAKTHILSNGQYDEYLKAIKGTQLPSDATLVSSDTGQERGRVFVGTCYLCNVHTRKRLDDRSSFLSVTLLPHSRVYPVVLWEEQYALKKVSQSSDATIDTYISLMQKRISELATYIEAGNPLGHSYADNVADRVTEYCAKIMKAFDGISKSDKERNREELQYILSGFIAKTEKLATVNRVGANLEKIVGVLEKTKQQLSPSDRFDPDIQGSFVVDIPIAGRFTLVVESSAGGQMPYVIDDKKQWSREVEFTQGIHRIEAPTTDARVYVRMVGETAQTSEYPLISYEQKDMTRFIVHVREATEPFILNFNASFDSGWEAYIRQKGASGKIRTTPVSQSAHILTDGYANGWRITEQGEYDIFIIYGPQRYVEFGIGITVLSVCLCIVYLFIKKKHGE